MAADIKFRLLSDDSDITGNSATPHQLTPYVLYRGMAVFQEYHEIYAINEGTTLYDPAHTLSRVSGPGNLDGKYKRQVTGSIKDGGSTDTVYIAYVEAGASLLLVIGPTAVPDANNEMLYGRCYDLWSQYQMYNVAATIGPAIFRHTLGGTD